MPARGSGHGGILALGINHERRSRPCRQIGDDGRAALAAAACGYGDEVPVIRAAHNPAGGIDRAAEQQLPLAVTMRPIVEQAAEDGRAAHADEARAHEAGERGHGLADAGAVPRDELERDAERQQKRSHRPAPKSSGRYPSSGNIAVPVHPEHAPFPRRYRNVDDIDDEPPREDGGSEEEGSIRDRADEAAGG